METRVRARRLGNVINQFVQRLRRLLADKFINQLRFLQRLFRQILITKVTYTTGIQRGIIHVVAVVSFQDPAEALGLQQQVSSRLESFRPHFPARVHRSSRIPSVVDNLRIGHAFQNVPNRIHPDPDGLDSDYVLGAAGVMQELQTLGRTVGWQVLL